MKRIKASQQGFSLTEVLIGIMILTVAIVSATSLLVGLINSNKNNVKTLQAYYLAQEGIEAVRNIRDTNWLYNIEWDNKLAAGSYVIGLNDLGNLGAGAEIENSRSVDQLFLAYSPWTIAPASNNSEIRLSDSGYMSSNARGDSVSTGFTRTITIMPYGDEGEHILVQAKVTWEDSGRDREVILEEILTDWKGGAI